jgi:hypothetical protein
MLLVVMLCLAHKIPDRLLAHCIPSKPATTVEHDRAVATIAGVKLLHRIRKGQFNLGRLRPS